MSNYNTKNTKNNSNYKGEGYEGTKRELGMTGTHLCLSTIIIHINLFCSPKSLFINPDPTHNHLIQCWTALPVLI